MKKTTLLTIIVISAFSVVSLAGEQAIPDAGIAPASNGLGDLNTMTFSCPKAGLNAAAREAAIVPSEGRYQFSYFRIINSSDHSLYEIHFKSNYQEEADLKYCVSVYCQQGQAPTPSVRLIRNEPQPNAVSATHCDDQPTPVQGFEPKHRLNK